MIFSIRKQYLNYLSQARKKQFEIPKYLELLVDKAIDLFNLSGISCVDMLQYMLEHDINNYTKNQYDIDTYLNKYSDCNEDMPIDTYTSSNELHYKIWCIEGGKYSRETWYRLMVVSLNQEYVELLDEILE